MGELGGSDDDGGGDFAALEEESESLGGEKGGFVAFIGTAWEVGVVVHWLFLLAFFDEEPLFLFVAAEHPSLAVGAEGYAGLDGWGWILDAVDHVDVGVDVGAFDRFGEAEAQGKVLVGGVEDGWVDFGGSELESHAVGADFAWFHIEGDFESAFAVVVGVEALDSWGFDGGFVGIDEVVD